MSENVVPGGIALLLLFGLVWVATTVLNSPTATLEGTGCSSEIRYDWTLEDAKKDGSATPEGAIVDELTRVRSRVADTLARGAMSDVVAGQVAQEQGELIALAKVEPVAEESRSPAAGSHGLSVWRTPSNVDVWGEVHLVQPEGTDRWVVDRAGWAVDPGVCSDARESQAAVERSATATD